MIQTNNHSDLVFVKIRECFCTLMSNESIIDIVVVVIDHYIGRPILSADNCVFYVYWNRPIGMIYRQRDSSINVPLFKLKHVTFVVIIV